MKNKTLKAIEKIGQRISEAKSEKIAVQKKISKLEAKKIQKIDDAISSDSTVSFAKENRAIIETRAELGDINEIIKKLEAKQSELSDQYKQSLIEAEEKRVQNVQEEYDAVDNEIGELRKKITELSKRLNLYGRGDVAEKLHDAKMKLLGLEQRDPLELAGLSKKPEQEISIDAKRSQEIERGWLGDIRKKNKLSRNGIQGFKFLARECGKDVQEKVIDQMEPEEAENARKIIAIGELRRLKDDGASQALIAEKLAEIGVHSNSDLYRLTGALEF